MTEFKDMDKDKEMRSANKLRADMHLGMIQIDEAFGKYDTSSISKINE